MSDPGFLPRTPVPGDRVVTRAFEDAGAVSPASARPLTEIPGVDPAAVVSLAARGVVREASAGRYYLRTGTEHARGRVLLWGLTVVLVLLVPVLLLQFTAR